MKSTTDTDAPRSQAILETLRTLLLDGELAADARLNEVQLSRRFNVSRTPIRAALQTLAGEGLLEYTPNRGYKVRIIPLTEIVDSYEMRALAEGLAARLAAERGLTPAHQAEIERVLTLGDKVLKDSKRNDQRAIYGDVNDRFHGTIHDAAGSRLVDEVIRLCHRVPHASTHNIVSFEIDDIRRRHSEHHGIFEAILFREPKKAEGLMQAHVLGVKSSVARRISKLELQKGDQSGASGRASLRTA